MQVKLPWRSAIIEDKVSLVSLRIWLNVINFVHITAVATNILNIDFEQSNDPDLRSYSIKKWKLITTWSNLLYASYLPVSIYCDCKELKSETRGHVVLLNKIRHECFTGILAPSIAFSDILFWRLWNKDKTLIASQAILEEYIPFWSQHSMHTMSLIFVIADLLLVPRKRPKNILSGFVLTFVFLTSYITLCIVDMIHGKYTYPLCKTFSGDKLMILVLFVYLEHAFYYFLQWLLVDFMWNTKKCDVKLS